VGQAERDVVGDGDRPGVCDTAAQFGIEAVRLADVGKVLNLFMLQAKLLPWEHEREHLTRNAGSRAFAIAMTSIELTVSFYTHRISMVRVPGLEPGRESQRIFVPLRLSPPP
jgi:hypothetical protein